jgi:membrane protease YdiL (CAAX protease family)
MRPIALAYVVACVALTALGAYVAFQPARSETPAMWLFAGGPTVVLAAVAAYWANREELLREWLEPRWGDFTRGLAGAVALYGAAWAFARVVAPVGSPREIWLASFYGQLGDPRSLQRYGPLVAVTIVVVTVAEEIVWRGMVTQLLADRLGSRTAWVWAAGLYAVSFLPSAYSLSVGSTLNPILLLGAAAGGVLWGGMARAFGRLGPSIIAHALFDWAVVMMFPLWGLAPHLPPH